jgi:hypothetical protein
LASVNTSIQQISGVVIKNSVANTSTTSCSCSTLSSTFANLTVICGGNTTEINVNNQGIQIRDLNNSLGAVYCANYAANGGNNPRWIPDVAWVTGKTSVSGVQTANNGLTKVGTDVRLGGTITGDTQLCGFDNNLNALTLINSDPAIFGCIKSNFTCFSAWNSGATCLSTMGVGESEILLFAQSNEGIKLRTDNNDACYNYICVTTGATYLGSCRPSYAGAQYCADYSTNYTNRSLVDKEYVDNVVVSSGATAVLAVNGLNKSGNSVRLGGTLTGNTVININSYNLILSGTTGKVLNFVGNPSTNYGYVCVDSNYVTLETQNGTNFAYVDINRSANTITNCAKGGDLIFTTCRVTGVGGQFVINAPSGATYAACYHSNYTDRTLVDKEYVDKKQNCVCVGLTNTDPYYVTNVYGYIGVSGVSCVYLPPSPGLGYSISIADICGDGLSAPITVDGNGVCINGMTDGYATINTNYGSISFVYNGYFWSAVAFIN